MRILRLVTLASLGGAHLLACSSSSDSGDDSFVGNCDGHYICEVAIDLDYDPGLNELVLSPDSLKPGSCTAGSDVEFPLSGVDLNPDGTITNYDTQIGTWTSAGPTLTVCLGSVCASCSKADGEDVGSPTPACGAILGCNRDLPWVPGDLPADPKFTAFNKNGICTLTPDNVETGTFEPQPDGTLLAQGFPVGTWTGTKENVQICIFGECTPCAL
jgi:hypothetical protein